MLRLTRASDGAPVYVSAALVSAVSPDLAPENTEVCAGNFTHIVRESPDEVARLVAEATRPAAGVDLEAVETARRMLARLAEACAGYPALSAPFGRAIDRTVGLDNGSWDDTAAALRTLAARLGGAP